MRRKNWRTVIAGLLLIVLAVVFYNIVMAAAPQSTDPLELTMIISTVSGTVIGISGVMILIGLIGKKA